MTQFLMNEEGKFLLDGSQIINRETPVIDYGYSLYFGADTESVLVPNNASLNVTDNISISYWVNTSVVVAQHIFGSYAGSGGYAGYGFALSIGGFAGPAYWSSNKFSWQGSSTSVQNGQWNHVVMTIASNGAGNTYINGSFDSSFSSAAPAVWNSSKRIAARVDNDPDTNFIGTLDEVALWNEVLTANDAADLYNGGDGLCINPSSNWPTDGGSMGTNLMALWHFNEGSDVTANDSSGNGNTGTLQNMDNSNWVTGKVQC